MATLHFVCGKAGSGKTTLARELAARHAAVLFGEDEWLTLPDAQIDSLADHVRHSKRLRASLAPLAVRLLQLGMPIVFDFAGNTVGDRAWVRSIFDSANAAHVLHYIVASDESCKARLRFRNETKPEGLYSVCRRRPVRRGHAIFHATIRPRKLRCDLLRGHPSSVRGAGINPFTGASFKASKVRSAIYRVYQCRAFRCGRRPIGAGKSLSRQASRLPRSY